MKKFLILIVSIMAASIIAIIGHVIVPSGIPLDKYNSFLIHTIGFPLTTFLYFIVLFFHIAVVCYVISIKRLDTRQRTGLRVGMAFGMLYLVGMQEIVPSTDWNLGMISKQLIVGVGDMIPAVLFSLVMVSLYALRQDRRKYHAISFGKRILAPLIFCLCFTIERTIAGVLGLIDSAIYEYMIPTLVWTILLGLTLGISYLLIYPFYKEYEKVSRVLIISIGILGLNWTIFNSFMAMIMDGWLIPILIRVGLDILAMIIAEEYLSGWEHPESNASSEAFF